MAKATYNYRNSERRSEKHIARMLFNAHCHHMARDAKYGSACNISVLKTHLRHNSETEFQLDKAQMEF